MAGKLLAEFSKPTGGKANWGYNALNNGNNQENLWHSLTILLWAYVFNTRQTVSGKRYAKATVNGISSIFLLPDNWHVSTYNLKTLIIVCLIHYPKYSMQ